MTTIWTARIVPVDPHPDPPTPTRERWHSSEFAVAGERPWRIPVLVAHDRDLQVGHLYLLRERRGWAEADFVLTDAEAEQVMRIGQPVSIGGRQLTGKVKLRWINELSLVAEGAIRGAEVIGRRELRTTTTPLPSATTARTAAPGEVIYGDGTVIRRPGIGQVLRVR